MWTMIASFEDAGIRFKYPENWKLEREATESGWTISVNSPETAFFMLSLHEDMPSSDCLVETALAALREVYPDLEVEECAESLAGQPAVGCNIWFFSLDLTNTCWLRSLYSAQGTLLVMCQFNDLESEKNELVLRAICASLELEDE
jgi:hypothetical protein